MGMEAAACPSCLSWRSSLLTQSQAPLHLHGDMPSSVPFHPRCSQLLLLLLLVCSGSVAL